MQTLPSSQPATPREPTLILEPFRAVRYAPAAVRGLAEVTSPPYDVIGPAAVTRLLATEPHNVVQLIVPQADAVRPGGSYGDAAATLERWRDQGVLIADAGPALHVYEQRDAAGTVLQRGLIGAAGLCAPDEKVILPHEDVMPGPVAGRLALMEAAQANLEPIFLLYDGTGGAATQLVDEVATTRPPLVDVVTEDGLRHRLWTLTRPAELTAVAADLAPRQALIADGHHRYAAYRELQARMRAAGAGAGPWDRGLALLVDSAAYPPRIGAIHRVLPTLRPAEAVALASRAFRVRGVEGGLPAGLEALDKAAADGVAFLAGDGTGLHLLTSPDPVQVAAAMPPDRSAHWCGLAASVLQQLLIGTLWALRDDERTVRIVHDDPRAAVRIAAETGGSAVICPPITARDVYLVAADGERVPRKSTSFGPKPRTGLVMRVFADG